MLSQSYFSDFLKIQQYRYPGTVPTALPTTPYLIQKAVLRIRDILVRIRIQGSIPITDPGIHTSNGPDPTPDPDTGIFVSEIHNDNKK